MNPLESILVTTDFSDAANQALQRAALIATQHQARLTLLHVVDPLTHITGFERPEVYVREIVPAMRSAAEGLLAKAREGVAAAGVPVETALVESQGERVSEIVVEQARAWPADLIVIGTHGRRGVDRVLMGSDAEQIARRAPVPVLLVRLG